MSSLTGAGVVPRATARTSMRLLTPGLSAARRISVPESVTARLIFLSIVLGSSRTRTVPSSVPPVADLGDAVLGDDEDVLAEARVEALGRVAHELEVLALVLADRHLVGAVGEHVGGLEDRVEEQARGGELALG